MEICVPQTPSSSTRTHRSNKYVHVDEPILFQRQSEGQYMSSQQVSHFKTLSFQCHKKVRIEPYSCSSLYSQGVSILLTQMDMLLEAINGRFSEHEKKIGRQLMEVEHRHDAKLMSMTEDIIDIRSKSSNHPRLAKAEDEIKELRTEI